MATALAKNIADYSLQHAEFAKLQKVRHVAIWQIVISTQDSLHQKCFENDMADIYFKRHSNKNFIKLVEEYDQNPNDYNDKFKKMKKKIWTNVLAGPVPPKRITLYLFVAFFNEDWTLAEEESVPMIYPRFPDQISRAQTSEIERWALREMLTNSPSVTNDNMFVILENIEGAMDIFVKMKRCESISSTEIFVSFCGKKTKQQWNEIMAGKRVCVDADSNDEVFFMKAREEIERANELYQTSKKKPDASPIVHVEQKVLSGPSISKIAEKELSGLQLQNRKSVLEHQRKNAHTIQAIADMQYQPQIPKKEPDASPIGQEEQKVSSGPSKSKTVEKELSGLPQNRKAVLDQRKNAHAIRKERKEAKNVKSITVTQGKVEDYDIEKVLKNLGIEDDESKKKRKSKKKSKQKQPENVIADNDSGLTESAGQAEAVVAGGQQQQRPSIESLQMLMTALKAPNTPENQQKVLTILKQHPSLMAAFLKERALQQQKNGQGQNQTGGLQGPQNSPDPVVTPDQPQEPQEPQMLQQPLQSQQPQEPQQMRQESQQPVQPQEPPKLMQQDQFQQLKKVSVKLQARLSNANDLDENECSICFCNREQTFAMIPCGHATFCQDCSLRICNDTKRRCPTCQTPTTGRLRIFQ